MTGYQVRVEGLHLAPKGSHTGFREGRFTSASPRQRETQASLAYAMREARAGGPPLEGPVAVRLVFTRKRPADHYSARGGLKPWAEVMRYSPNSPDLDKQVRTALDAMTDAGWFLDDRQVAAEESRKPWGDLPGVAAWAWPL